MLTVKSLNWKMKSFEPRRKKGKKRNSWIMRKHSVWSMLWWNKIETIRGSLDNCPTLSIGRNCNTSQHNKWQSYVTGTLHIRNRNLNFLLQLNQNGIFEMDKKHTIHHFSHVIWKTGMLTSNRTLQWTK